MRHYMIVYANSFVAQLILSSIFNKSLKFKFPSPNYNNNNNNNNNSDLIS